MLQELDIRDLVDSSFVNAESDGDAPGDERDKRHHRPEWKVAKLDERGFDQWVSLLLDDDNFGILFQGKHGNVVRFWIGLFEDQKLGGNGFAVGFIGKCRTTATGRIDRNRAAN